MTLLFDGRKWGAYGVQIYHPDGTITQSGPEVQDVPDAKHPGQTMIQLLTTSANNYADRLRVHLHDGTVELGGSAYYALEKEVDPSSSASISNGGTSLSEWFGPGWDGTAPLHFQLADDGRTYRFKIRYRELPQQASGGGLLVDDNPWRDKWWDLPSAAGVRWQFLFYVKASSAPAAADGAFAVWYRKLGDTAWVAWTAQPYYSINSSGGLAGPTAGSPASGIWTNFATAPTGSQGIRWLVHDYRAANSSTTPVRHYAAQAAVFTTQAEAQNWLGGGTGATDPGGVTPPPIPIPTGVPGLPTNVRNLAIAKDPTTGGPILTPAWEAPTDKIAADLANLYVSVNQAAPAATALVTLAPGINGTSATLRLDGVATASQSAVTGVWGQKAWIRVSYGTRDATTGAFIRDGGWAPEPPLEILLIEPSTKPATPAQPPLSAGTSTSVTLTLGALPTGVASRTIRRAVNTGAGYGAYADLATSVIGTSYVDNTLTSGNAYRYVVIDIGANLLPSDPSQPAEYVAVSTPAKPTIAVTTPAEGVIKVAWSGGIPATVFVDGAVAAQNVPSPDYTLTNQSFGPHVVKAQTGIAPNLSPESDPTTATVWGVALLTSALTLTAPSGGAAVSGKVSITGVGTFTVVIPPSATYLGVDISSGTLSLTTPTVLTFTLTPGAVTPGTYPVDAEIQAASSSALQVPTNLTLPVIPGTPRQGTATTATAGTYSPTPSSTARQWQRTTDEGATFTNCTGTNPTTLTYTPNAADVGTKLAIQEIPTNGAGAGPTVRSALSAVVLTTVGAPTNTALPQITGTAQSGSGLVGSTGTWDDNGSAITGYVSRLQRKGLVRGVVMSGGEFGAAVPGVYDTDFHYPGSADFAFVAARGHRLAFVPFMWSRLQRTLNSALDATELARVQAVVAAAAANNMNVVLIPYDKGRWQSGATTYQLGDSNLPQAYFTDFWTRVSTAFKNDTTVTGYGLMNEPYLTYQPVTTFGELAPGSGTFESGITNWTATGATLAQSATRAHGGTNAARLTSTAGGTIFLNPTARSPIPTGRRVNAEAWITTDVTARAVDLTVYWYDALTAGTFLGQSTLEAKNDTTSFVRYSGLSPVAPAGATHFSIAVGIAGTATSEVHRIDDFTFQTATQPTNAAAWEPHAQAAVTAIRNNGDKKLLYVSGGNFSAASTWTTLHPAPFITDPASNFIYVADFYFDDVASGAYANTYATEVTNSTGQGYTAGTNADSFQSRTLARLKVFTDWLAANSVKGHIGEYGWRINESLSSWNALGEKVLSALDAANVGATAFFVSPWFVGAGNAELYYKASGTAINTANGQAATIEGHAVDAGGASDYYDVALLAGSGASITRTLSALDVGFQMREVVDATNAIDTTRATSALTSVVSASSSLALARYAMQFDGSGQVLLNTGTATNADPKTLVACFFNSAGAADTVIRFLFAQATSTSDRGKGMWMYTANGSVGWWDQAFGGLGQSAMPRNAWVCAMVGRGTDANKTIRAAWIPMTGGPGAGSALYQSGASEAIYAAGTYTGHRMIGRSYDLEQSSFPGSGFQGQVLSILEANVLYTLAQFQALVSSSGSTYYVDPAVWAAAPSKAGLWVTGGDTASDVTSPIQDLVGTAHEASRAGGITTYDAGSGILPLKV